MDPGATPKTPEVHWDAGAMGCGELIIELRQRMRELSPGSVFELVAHDPGAIEDIPSWCRLSGHRLLRASPPTFLLQRKAD